jgi:hypothetical protein
MLAEAAAVIVVPDVLAIGKRVRGAAVASGKNLLAFNFTFLPF